MKQRAYFWLGREEEEEEEEEEEGLFSGSTASF
jgi:hypothetical protein